MVICAVKEIKSILSSRFHTAMRRWRERNFVIKSVKVLEELYINKIRKSKKEGVKMAYAEKTSISVARTKADIEELVQKYGASQFVSGYKDNLAVIGFLCRTNQRGNTGTRPAVGNAGQRRRRIPLGSKPAGAGGGHCI